MERQCHIVFRHSKNGLRLHLRQKKQKVGGKNRKGEGRKADRTCGMVRITAMPDWWRLSGTGSEADRRPKVDMEKGRFIYHRAGLQFTLKEKKRMVLNNWWPTGKKAFNPSLKFYSKGKFQMDKRLEYERENLKTLLGGKKKRISLHNQGKEDFLKRAQEMH